MNPDHRSLGALTSSLSGVLSTFQKHDRQDDCLPRRHSATPLVLKPWSTADGFKAPEEDKILKRDLKPEDAHGATAQKSSIEQKYRKFKAVRLPNETQPESFLKTTQRKKYHWHVCVPPHSFTSETHHPDDRSSRHFLKHLSVSIRPRARSVLKGSDYQN